MNPLNPLVAISLIATSVASIPNPSNPPIGFNSAQNLSTADDLAAYPSEFTQTPNPNEYAFASVLSSEGFILAARVMAFTLRRLEPSVPYLILYTEDVDRGILWQLEGLGVQLVAVRQIDTPVQSHLAKKFQYTKLHLWTLTDYSSIVHLDLDTIVLDEIHELFGCGQFCASLRHSDMFNSGVFVLRPNLTTFNEMLLEMNGTDSYDGGDQGFMNSFFDSVKYSTMFRPNVDSKSDTAIRRLSAAYNYDAGIYYLSGRRLVDPKVIHYTMAFVKPWHWYGYPIFNLNWAWLERRVEMHKTAHEFQRIHLSYGKYMLVAAAVFAAVTLANRLPCGLGERGRASKAELTCVTSKTISISILTSLRLTPLHLLPPAGWVVFAVNLTLCIGTISTVYARIRQRHQLSLLHTFRIGLVIATMITVAWHGLQRINQPGPRFLVAIIMIILTYATVAILNVRGMLPRTRTQRRTDSPKPNEVDRLLRVE